MRFRSLLWPLPTIVGLVSTVALLPSAVRAQNAEQSSTASNPRTDRDRALVCEVRGLHKETNGDGASGALPRPRSGTMRVWLIGDRDARFAIAGRTGFLRPLEDVLHFEQEEILPEGVGDRFTKVDFDPVSMRVEGLLSSVTYVKFTRMGAVWHGQWNEEWAWSGACVAEGA